MNLDLSGKNALVCGSSQGIGKAAAIELALLGCAVTLVSRNEEKLARTVEELDASKGQTHHYLVADFNDVLGLKRQTDILAEEKTIHILVNNTGGPASGRIIDAGPGEFLKAINAHLIASHMLVQTFVNGMNEAGYGRIINVISTSVKQPIPDLGVSNTTRAAMANWAKTLAGELGPSGITVNSVLPGSTDTERHRSLLAAHANQEGISINAASEAMKGTIPLGRFADPLEVGAVIAFLASPAAGYITGINFPVDGGRTKCL